MAIISTRPSVALVKTRWRKKGARTLADRAGVIGANVWKISLEIFKHMEKEGFRFGSDRLVAHVLAGIIRVPLPLSPPPLSPVGGGCADHRAVTMETNQLDLLGPGEYRKPFIALLNARFGEYAGFECPGGEPGYPCVRFFATKVSDAMASSDNKWVVEQIMDIEAPEMVRVIRKLVDQAANTASP